MSPLVVIASLALACNAKEGAVPVEGIDVVSRRYARVTTQEPQRPEWLLVRGREEEFDTLATAPVVPTVLESRSQDAKAMPLPRIVFADC